MEDNVKKDILISVVGKTDPIRSQHDGPILHIVRNYRPEKVYLILTQEIGRDEQEYHHNEQAIHMLEPDCQVQTIMTDIRAAHSYDDFSRIFLTICNQIKQQNPGCRLLLNITSGTPQMETALCMIGISDPKVYLPVQVETPENAANKSTMFDPRKDLIEEWFETNLDNEEGMRMRCKTPRLINFKRPIIQFQIVSLIQNYDYAGAYQLFEENRQLFSEKAGLLLHHAKSRLNLEKQEAEKIAEKLNMKQTLYPVNRADIGQLVEFYNSMRVKQIRGELNDFSMRLEIMTEYLGIYILEKGMRISLDDLCTKKKRKNTDIYYTSREMAEKKIPGICSYMNSQFSNTKTGQYEWGRAINSLSIVLFVQYLSRQEKFKRFRNSAEEMRKWTELSAQIRNPAAHSIITITESLIKDAYDKNSEALCNAMRTVLIQVFGTEVKADAFEVYSTINREITEALER